MINSLSWQEPESLMGWLVRIKAKEVEYNRTGWYKVVNIQNESGNLWGSYGETEEEAIENYKKSYNSWDWAFFHNGLADTDPKRISKYTVSPIRKIF